MPPKPQTVAEDVIKAGIVTCTAAEYGDESRLAFVVQARLALVLDRKSLDDGQIIGMVMENDVVCASMVEFPWVMLNAGSSVRHPKMREGRIKLQRDGWLITSHPEYGELLEAFPADKVRRYYDEDLWLKLPIVKTKAKAKAKSSAQDETLFQSRRDAEEAARLAEITRIEEEKRREMDVRLGEIKRQKEQAAKTAKMQAQWDQQQEEQEQKRAEAEAALRRDREKAAAAAAAMRRKREKEAMEAKEAKEAAEAEGEQVREAIVKAVASPKTAQAALAKAGAAPAKAQAAAKASTQDKAGVPSELADARSVAAQFLPLARGIDPAVAAAKAAAAKARLKRALQGGSMSKAGQAEPAVAKAPVKAPLERVKGPPETLESHLRTCGGEHWKVVHDFVFLRSKASTSSDQISILRRGAVFCLGSAPNATVPEQRSADGKWVKCCHESKVWLKVEAQEPEYLLHSQVFPMGFVLTRNEEHGDLIRLVPNTKPADAPGSHGKDVLKPPEAPKDNGKPPPEPEQKADPVTQEAVAKMHHWVVESNTARAYTQRDEASTVEMTFQEGDIVMVGGATWTRMWSDISGRKWLLFPPGGQVYRKFQPILPSGGNKRSSYILVQDDDENQLAREYTPPETGVCVRFVSGYGEPWVVEHDQVVVRRGPSTTDVPVGIMLKGDVVGVAKKQGDWVQLVQDSDVRFRKKGTSGTEANSTFLSMVNSVRELKVEEEVLKQRRELGNDPLPIPTMPMGEPPLEAWMLVDHSSLGTLLRRARKRKGGLNNGVVISKSRLSLYREVSELCHRRIYEENLEGLWDGERDKLPTQECIEAKLFDSAVSVLHVSTKGHFCGGAIIKQVPVKAKQVEGSSNLNLTGHAGAGEVEERAGRTMVGYIDSCAAVPRTGGGRMLWDSISSMHFVCLTCHSILLQKTVDFWQACGMRRLDPSNKNDCEEFKKNILVHTMGKVILDLTDVEKELPSSKLPLFVWVPSRFSQVSIDPNSDYIFTPDDGEGYI